MCSCLGIWVPLSLLSCNTIILLERTRKESDIDQEGRTQELGIHLEVKHLSEEIDLSDELRDQALVFDEKKKQGKIHTRY